MLRGYLRACPRCHGDVFLDEDPFTGAHLACLQCGHALTPSEERALAERAARARVVA